MNNIFGLTPLGPDELLRFYRRIEIPKRNGTKRVVFAPDPTLKYFLKLLAKRYRGMLYVRREARVRHAMFKENKFYDQIIFSRINSMFPSAYRIFGYNLTYHHYVLYIFNHIRQNYYLKNSLKHVFVYETDIADFYPSITLNMFAEILNEPRFANKEDEKKMFNVLDEILEDKYFDSACLLSFGVINEEDGKGRLLQGSPLAPLFSMLFLSVILQKHADDLLRKGSTAVYADNIVSVSPYKSNVFKVLSDILARYDLTINEEKTKTFIINKSKPFNYELMGYTLCLDPDKQPEITISRSTTRKINRKLKTRNVASLIGYYGIITQFLNVLQLSNLTKEFNIGSIVDKYVEIMEVLNEETGSTKFKNNFIYKDRN